MKEGLTPSKIDQHLAKLKPQPVVALVDDDPATLELLDRTLRDEGYAVHRFERAEEFLAKVAEVKPDALVMEVVLSGMNGLSVLEELRPKSPEGILPTLILTKKDDLRAKLLAFRRGAFDYVTKPFEPEEVAARVRVMIRTKALQELLQMSSIADPLTSVYNRRFLFAWLSREMERVKRYGTALSCLAVDLDNFRGINEENGERSGDSLLRAFADFLNQNTRRADIVGRLENGEFLLLLPGTAKEGAMTVAHRLRERSLGQRFGLQEKQIPPSFSIGITASAPDHSAGAEAFVEKAEEALRKAKLVGPGKTAVLELD